MSDYIEDGYEAVSKKSVAAFINADRVGWNHRIMYELVGVWPDGYAIFELVKLFELLTGKEQRTNTIGSRVSALKKMGLIKYISNETRWDPRTKRDVGIAQAVIEMAVACGDPEFAKLFRSLARAQHYLDEACDYKNGMAQFRNDRLLKLHRAVAKKYDGNVTREQALVLFENSLEVDLA